MGARVIVLLGILLGFVAGLLVAVTLIVVTEDPVGEDVGRLIAGWRQR